MLLPRDTLPSLPLLESDAEDRDERDDFEQTGRNLTPMGMNIVRAVPSLRLGHIILYALVG